MTDYQRHSSFDRPAWSLSIAAALLCSCSPQEAERPADGPRPAMIVAGQLEEKELVETSGLARSQRQPGLLWAINDGGSKPRIHALDEHGSRIGRIRLEEARNKDWEDISSFTLDGEPYLLVADVGDNDAKRKKVTLYIVAEPDLAEDDKVKLEPSWRVDFRYPDGPRDVEAVAVDVASERVIVLSKRDVPPVLYEVPLRPASDETLTATRLGALTTLPQPTRQDLDQAIFTKDWNWQPTGMDLSADGTLATILTYRAVYVYRRRPDESLYETLSRRPYGLGLGNFRDAESVTFSAGGESIFVTVERRHAPLLRIDMNGAIPE